MMRLKLLKGLAISMAVVLLWCGQILGAQSQGITPTKVKAMSFADAGSINQKVGPNDSVIIISGRVDMGSADYYEAMPYIEANFYKGNQLFDVSACKSIEHYDVAQKKSAEAAGYKKIYVFRDTGVNQQCWKVFNEITKVAMTPSPLVQYIMVKKTADSKLDAWVMKPKAADALYPLGPVQPK